MYRSMLHLYESSGCQMYSLQTNGYHSLTLQIIAYHAVILNCEGRLRRNGGNATEKNNLYTIV